MNQAKIKEIIKQAISKKLENYTPETKHMPFHTRLLGKDRMALFSFIHSLNTTFGTSIFEPVAKAIAEEQFLRVKTQAVVGHEITTEAQQVIQTIMNDLGTANSIPNKQEELKRIKKVVNQGEIQQVKPTKIDILLQSKDNSLYLIDIKTAKPNKGGFKEFKRTLLEWAAIALQTNTDIKVHTLIAIPYNPYEPKPYQRWTMKGMLDLEEELKVGSEFWDFLGGEGTYEELLLCFEQAGIELREELNEYFLKFK